MRIGELSRHIGVSRDAIRQYEGRGLITFSADQAGAQNYHAYPEGAS